MQGTDGIFQSPGARLRCLQDRERLAGLLDAALPAIYRVDAVQHVGAGREAILDDPTADLDQRLPVRTRNEDDHDPPVHGHREESAAISRCASSYTRSIRSAYRSATTFRRTFWVGVSVPASIVKGSSNRMTCFGRS